MNQEHALLQLTNKYFRISEGNSSSTTHVLNEMRKSGEFDFDKLYSCQYAECPLVKKKLSVTKQIIDAIFKQKLKGEP